jgi:hypothetical protein
MFQEKFSISQNWPQKTLVKMGDLEVMSFASSCISRLQKLSTAQYILLSPGVGYCELWIMNLDLICSCGHWVEWLETLLWVVGNSFHINERKQWIPAIADYDSKPKPPSPPPSSVAQTPAMPMSCPFTAIK